MKKKKQQIRRQDNVILFPGVGERLLEQAHAYAESYQYDLACEAFAEALRYIEGDEISLSVYAYSLYEIRAFKQAKEVCEELLAIGPTMYFEAMELYLTISMQLREFKQVEKLIETLLDEDAIPENQLEKFQRLKNLNAEIANNQLLQQEAQQQNNAEFSIAHFLQLSQYEQLQVIYQLTDTNIRPIVQPLIQVIENEAIHPFIRSLTLILLVEQQVNTEVFIEKFQQQRTVNPADLAVPTELPQYKAIEANIKARLEKDPTTLEMVQQLLAKHAIVTYPFEWLAYDAEDVAQSYIDYVHMLFGQVQEMDYEIIEFLQQLETFSELH
ncbi:hypothetical protein [Metasolibacillus sp.]|uniref:hypothetical protein n=1 Tax=Metasolibacillus sp. TaxID=2703680 RepID=UPI0025D46993|nr:hypothetical protein [Metasolibacillus sp.]MCT6925485.1 hypothetical protein [Metasolibacillus sp.]MCT6941742.1 hypothetical protein [Metasolibacillus sp.]